MKKMISIALVSVIFLALAGCSTTENWKDKFRIDEGTTLLTDENGEYGRSYMITNLSYDTYKVSLVLEYQHDDANGGESWEVTYPMGTVDFMGSVEGDVSYREAAEEKGVKWDAGLIEAFAPVKESVVFEKA